MTYRHIMLDNGGKIVSTFTDAAPLQSCGGEIFLYSHWESTHFYKTLPQFCETAMEIHKKHLRFPFVWFIIESI